MINCLYQIPWFKPESQIFNVTHYKSHYTIYSNTGVCIELQAKPYLGQIALHVIITNPNILTIVCIGNHLGIIPRPSTSTCQERTDLMEIEG